MKTPSSLVSLPLVFCAALSFASPVTNIPPIIVEASRVDSPEMTMAASVHLLDREGISSTRARDLPELLEKGGGLVIRHLNANPLQSSVAMRGFGENSFGRVLVLVDGERLNNPDMEAPNLMRVPLAAIERIELLDGPQTVLYGDSASAGVINIRTVPPAGAETKTVLSACGGSWDTYGASFHTTGGEGDGISYAAGFDWISSDGYRQNGGYDLWHANGAIRRDGEDGSRLLFSIFADRGFYEMAGALSEADYAASDSPRKAQDGDATEDEADLYTYGLSLSGEIPLAGERRLALDASVARRRRDASWRGLYPMDSRYEAWSFSVTPRYIDETLWGDHDNVLLAGGDFHGDWYDVETTSSYGTVEPAYHRVSYAGFLRDEFHLSEKLSLVAGLRGERFESTWKDDGEQRWTWNEIAWEAGASYRPVEVLKVFGRASRFYRAPFCDEMNYVRFNDSLEPEAGHSFDAGIAWKPVRGCSVTFSGYHMEIEDEIFYNPQADKSLGYWMGYNENSPAKTRRTGFDLQAGWSREKTGSFLVSYHFVKASFSEGDYDGKKIPLVPEQILQVSGEWYLCDQVAIGGAARFLASQPFAGDFGNEHGELPGYGLFDGTIRLFPNPGSRRPVSIELTVSNIFDRKFSDFAGWNDLSGRTYYPGAGRSFFVNARLEF